MIYKNNAFLFLLSIHVYPSTNKTVRHDISEILLKVALNTISQSKHIYTMPDLSLYLSIWPRWPGGGHLPTKTIFYDGFLHMWGNFKFECVLFRSDSRHNDRVDSLLECATFRARVRGLIT